MIVIIGDKFQGKLAYVQSNFSYADNEILNNFQDYVRENLDKIASDIANEVTSRNIEVVIVDNISAGIVSMDATDRKWQEITGRTVALLCKSAEKVIRIHAGLPQILKGEIC